MKTLYVKPKDVEKKWYIIDASGQSLGRVAAKAAYILRGKHKPYYVPYHDLGDQVIIINAKDALLTGRKYQDKLYYHHTGHPGGIKVENYSKLIQRKPIVPIEKAIKGMLPKGPLGRKLFLNLRVYADSRHSHDSQKPIPVEIKG